MLFEDITTGALIYGVLIDIEGTTEEEIIELNNLIAATPLSLFIPGDTVYVPYEDGDLEAGVLGIVAASVCAYETPIEITNTHLANAQKAFERALKKTTASTKDSRIKAALEEAPTLYLSCCGPLPMSMLVCGARLQRSQSGEAQYQFYGHQDMGQYPMSSGIDGLLIESVGFAEVATVALNGTQIDRWKDRVPKISNPGIYLITSYD